jgi:hypothetical protein
VSAAHQGQTLGPALTFRPTPLCRLGEPACVVDFPSHLQFALMAGTCMGLSVSSGFCGDIIGRGQNHVVGRSPGSQRGQGRRLSATRRQVPAVMSKNSRRSSCQRASDGTDGALPWRYGANCTCHFRGRPHKAARNRRTRRAAIACRPGWSRFAADCSNSDSCRGALLKTCPRSAMTWASSTLCEQLALTHASRTFLPNRRMRDGSRTMPRNRPW